MPISAMKETMLRLANANGVSQKGRGAYAIETLVEHLDDNAAVAPLLGPAVAYQLLAEELDQLQHEVLLLEEPFLELREDLLTSAMLTNDEGITPLGLGETLDVAASPDVDHLRGPLNHTAEGNPLRGRLLLHFHVFAE